MLESASPSEYCPTPQRQEVKWIQPLRGLVAPGSTLFKRMPLLTVRRAEIAKGHAVAQCSLRQDYSHYMYMKMMMTWSPASCMHCLLHHGVVADHLHI